MSNDMPILATLKCNGPGVKWLSLNELERFTWFVFGEGDFPGCGESTAIIDTSVPGDFWPERCLKCETDILWDSTVVPVMEELEKRSAYDIIQLSLSQRRKESK